MAQLAKHGVPALHVNHGTVHARVILFSEVPEMRGIPLADPLGVATETRVPGIPSEVGSEASGIPGGGTQRASEPAANIGERAPSSFGSTARVVLGLSVVVVIEALAFVLMLLLDVVRLAATVLTWSLGLTFGPLLQVAARRGRVRRLPGDFQVETLFAQPPTTFARWHLLREAQTTVAVQKAYLQLTEYEASADRGRLKPLLAFAAAAAWAHPARGRSAHYGWYAVGRALYHRYELDQAAQDLDGAVTALTKARNVFSPAWAPRADRLRSRLLPLELPDVRLALGEALVERYSERGQGADLELAIAEYEAALLHERLRHPARALTDLVTAYTARYERTGSLIDIELAIDCVRQAEEAIDDSLQATHLVDLLRATCLLARYEVEARDEDIADALVVNTSLELDDSARAEDRAVLLCLRARVARLAVESGRLGALGDVEGLAGQLTATLDAQLTTTLRAEMLLECAACLLVRDRNAQDRGQARALAVDALSLLSPGSPRRGRAFLLLGRASVRYVADESGLSSRCQAQEYFAAAVEAARVSMPHVSLQAALEWTRLASFDGDVRAVAMACDGGVTTMTALVGVQLLRQHGEAWLRRCQALPATGAFALAMSGDPGHAVEILERGRLLLFADSLEGDRLGLEELRALGHDDLVNRFQTAATELRDSMSLDLALDGTASLKERAARMRRARRLFTAALAEIGNRLGADQAMISPTLKEVVGLAAQAPIVYVVAAEAGGVALVVTASTPNSVKVVRLPGLTISVVDRIAVDYLLASRFSSTTSWERVLDETAGWLGQEVMRPILRHLDGAGRIVLIPIGKLALLPLHASWWHAGSACDVRRSAVDLSCVTYAPSARALRYARLRPPTLDERDTLLAYADDPPYARREIISVEEHLDRRHETLRPPISRLRLLEELPKWPVVHIACHAKADLDKPLSGGIETAEGRVTVRDLLGRHLDATRLVILSACETSLPGHDLADEVVSLPLALIQGGATGVIASMWRVPDVATALVMVRFHDLWRSGVFGPWEALRQAQLWVRSTTNGEQQASYPLIFDKITAGMDEDTLAAWAAGHVRTHPNEWAGFAYVGA